MKERSADICIGFAAVIGIPVLLLLQQFLMPKNKPAIPEHLERDLNYRLLAAA